MKTSLHRSFSGSKSDSRSNIASPTQRFADTSTTGFGYPGDFFDKVDINFRSI
jgi:hypothetical protein